MRILHVASAVSPDNRFGGPTRVALDLARGLRGRGHQVVLAAAAVGYRTLPTEIGGVPAVVARGVNPTPLLGWASLVAPGLERRVRHHLRGADLVHIHLARDVVTLRAGLATLRSGLPYVIQTHGMIDEPGGPLARGVDAVATGRVLRGAAHVLVLTSAERRTVAALGVPAARIETLRNGVDAPGVNDAAAEGEVLFLARLHPRKGALAFARAAVAIAGRRPDLQFGIVGPDEGDADAVDRVLAAAPPGVRRRVVREGGVDADEARRRLAAARIVVLPAAKEPFGMTIVEAMAAGRPVVVADDAELAPDIRAAQAGWTFGATRTLEAVIEAAVKDDVEGHGRRAQQLVDDRFRLDGVLNRLESLYQEVCSSRVHG